MITNKEVAARLAAITGKPVSEFFKNENEKPIERQYQASETICSVVSAGHTKPDVCNTGTEKTPETITTTEIRDLEEYQKIFKDSRIVKGVILRGRRMTKEEYRKFTKGLTRKQLLAHPLMYKMFRAKDQLDPNFITWIDRFPEEENDDSDE